jgi:hypothetical protein
MDTLNALMLIAWSEYKAGRVPSEYSMAFQAPSLILSGFRTHAQLAMNMAMDLGINNLPSMPTNDRQENRRRTTYQGILLLSVTANNGMISPLGTRRG